MTKTVIITVTTPHPVAMLDPLDRQVPGTYGVLLGYGPGEYPELPRGEVEQGDDPLHQAAYDVFHDHIGIERLDDFIITADLAHTEDDEPDDVHWL